MDYRDMIGYESEFLVSKDPKSRTALYFLTQEMYDEVKDKDGSIELEAEDDQYNVIFPLEWVVCDGCRGEGSYVNPNIDRHGLTRDDFDEDPDFEEAYFNGAYDVPCAQCNGKRVILGVVREHLSWDQKVLWDVIESYSEAYEIEREREFYCERNLWER